MRKSAGWWRGVLAVNRVKWWYQVVGSNSLNSQSWMGFPPGPYTGTGCFWRRGWQCAPWSRLSVRSHLQETETLITLSLQRCHIWTASTRGRRTYCRSSWPWFCARCRPGGSPGRSCSGPWTSAGGRTSSGSPSWSQPTATGSEPSGRGGSPGGRRAAAPAGRLSSRVSCLRPSRSKKRRFPAATFQMLCCPGVWRQFLFKASRVPLLLTSSA